MFRDYTDDLNLTHSLVFKGMQYGKSLDKKEYFALKDLLVSFQLKKGNRESSDSNQYNFFVIKTILQVP